MWWIQRGVTYLWDGEALPKLPHKEASTQLSFSFIHNSIWFPSFHTCVCCCCWSSNEENYGIPFVFICSIDEYPLSVYQLMTSLVKLLNNVYSFNLYQCSFLGAAVRGMHPPCARGEHNPPQCKLPNAIFIWQLDVVSWVPFWTNYAFSTSGEPVGGLTEPAHFTNRARNYFPEAWLAPWWPVRAWLPRAEPAST
jgi:hypothetical protein